jgi:hypothetical protein
MKAYDIDGVITKGIVPEKDAIIITGRSFEEAPETYKYLHDKGIFNAVYFLPKPFIEKDLDLAGKWKGVMTHLTDTTEFYEDNPIQATLINLANPECIIHLIK